MLDHHLAMFAARNLEGMIDDFAADAVWINADGVLNGKAAIRAHYAPAFSRPAAAPGQGPRIYLKLYSQNVAYMLWVRDEGKPSEQRGAESYWVRDGLIVAQTVGNFRTPPPATEPKNP